MTVKNLHVAVWVAGMIDVVRAVPAPAPVEAPASIDRADSQEPAVRTPLCLGGRDPLAGILGNLSAAFYPRRSETTFTVDP
jgi:hypothetical protein